MLLSAYKDEMARISPGEEELERLYALVEEGFPSRKPRLLGKRVAAAILVCAALFAAALAAGPTVWELIQGHMGERAPYAGQLEEVACVDQGIELRAVAALADQGVTRVYLTLRDLEGGRLDGSRIKTSLWALEPSDGTLSGPVEQVGWDEESKTVTLCADFYGRRSTEPLRVLMDGVAPGYRSVEVNFLTDPFAGELAAAIPAEPLESERLPGGRVVLLPGQNPQALPCEGTAPGEAPGLSISSMGFAEDGRLHVRFRIDGAAGLVLPFMGGDFPQVNLLLLYDGFQMRMAEAVDMTPVEDGVDVAFWESEVSPGDHPYLAGLGVYWSWSARDGAITGEWELEIPLEPVEHVELAWTGGPAEAPQGFEDTVIEKIALSPLSVTVFSHGHHLPEEEPITVTLEDGSLLSPTLVRRDGVGGACTDVWTFDTPVELDQVVTLSYLGETIRLEQPK